MGSLAEPRQYVLLQDPGDELVRLVKQFDTASVNIPNVPPAATNAAAVQSSQRIRKPCGLSGWTNVLPRWPMTASKARTVAARLCQGRPRGWFR